MKPVPALPGARSAGNPAGADDEVTMPDSDASDTRTRKEVEVAFPGSPRPARIPAQNLSELIHDGRSWINFLKMLCGGPDARMRIKADDKPAEFVVVTMPRD